MKEIKDRYKHYFTDKAFVLSLIIGIIFLGVAMVVNFYASAYAFERASNSVTDVILNNTRVYDVDEAFVYGPIIFWIFATVIALLKPQRIPFLLKSISLFIIIRAIFVSLTHIAPFPSHVIIPHSVLQDFTLGSDLFFSGHTGLPFLMALIYWQNKTLCTIFFIISIFFGIVVLLGHLHYTIDVVSAFFITYTIYHIASVFFKKDKKTFSSVVGN